MPIQDHFTASKTGQEHKLHKCHTESDRGPDRSASYGLSLSESAFIFQF